MNADGRNVRLLASTAGRATGPGWSPDGTQIRFTNGLSKACSVDRQMQVAKLND